MTKCKKNTMFRYFKRPSNADQAANKRPKLDEQTSEPLDEDISAESAVDGQKSPLNDKSASSSSIESAETGAPTTPPTETAPPAASSVEAATPETDGIKWSSQKLKLM